MLSRAAILAEQSKRTNTHIQAVSKPRKAPIGDDELTALKNSFDFLELVQQDTGEHGYRSGDCIHFDVCPICGHRDCFRYYPDGATGYGTFYCFGANGEVGGDVIEYIKATKRLATGEAIHYFKHELCSIPRPNRPLGKDGYERTQPAIELPPIERAICDRSKLPPRKPEIISGVLRAGHKMLLVAGSKTGKTWALIQLMAALATGGTWLGRSCAQGRVLYLNFELDSASFHNRVFEVAEAMNADPIECSENFDIWNLRGHAAQLNDLVDEILARVGEGKYIAIALDPVYKLQGGDENSAEAISRFCRSLDELATELGCAVIYVHHHSKGYQAGKATEDRASGSGVFARDCDALIDFTELSISNNAYELIQAEGGNASTLTAFRIETVLREFPDLNPFYTWFDCPLHILDSTGALAACKPKYGGDRGASTEDRQREIAHIDSICEELIEGRDSFLLAELEEALDVVTNTAKSKLDSSPLFKYIPGVNGAIRAKVARR